MGVIEELEAITGKVAASVGPAVVGVGHGSGVVVADGTVLTNAHNLHGTEAKVAFADGRRAAGRVGGVDVDGDLAVIAVDTGGVTPVVWTGDVAAAPGTVVVSVANPGGRGVRATMGQVSAVGRAFRGPRGRRIRGSLEHTAPMVKGSSGGPVVRPDGRLVGINTNRLGEGFYLALPADAELRARVDALVRGESATRPHLGVALAPSRAARHLRQAVGLPPRDGLLVRVVEDGSPAARAGILVGDLLVAVGGRPLARIDDLHEVLDGTDAEAALAVQLVRGVEEVELTVTLSATETPEDGPAPG